MDFYTISAAAQFSLSSSCLYRTIQYCKYYSGFVTLNAMQSLIKDMDVQGKMKVKEAQYV